LIHPWAVVHIEAELGAAVRVGPFSVIGEHVKIGDGTSIASNVTIEPWTEIGNNCEIAPGAVIGGLPQDLKFDNQRSYVRIGSGCVLREFVTVHRSSRADQATIIGDGCYLMAYAHVGHDGKLGERVTLTSYVGLSGHVTVEDKALLGGFVAVHQFTRIGALAMVSGCSRVVKDVVPYAIVEGNPARVRGTNVVGMRRNEFPPEVRNAIKQVFKLLFFSSLNTSQALEQIRATVPQIEQVKHLVEFVECSERGICK